MKKVIIVALLAIGLTGFAQEGKKKKGHEHTTEMKLKKMTEELTLTADQQKQMSSIIEEQDALRKANKENPENKEANKGKMKEITNKIKSILTPEQLKTWKSREKKESGKKGGENSEEKPE